MKTAKIFIIIAAILICSFNLYSQSLIGDFYRDNRDLTTEGWVSPGTVLNETNDGLAYEGTNHYRWDYPLTNDWIGGGIDVVTGSAAISESGYLRFAYRTSGEGLASWQRKITLTDALGVSGAMIDITNSVAYRVLTIPMSNIITNGSAFDANQFKTFKFEIWGVKPVAGYIYFDKISFTNDSPDITAPAPPAFQSIYPLGDKLVLVWTNSP